MLEEAKTEAAHSAAVEVEQAKRRAAEVEASAREAVVAAEAANEQLREEHLRDLKRRTGALTEAHSVAVRDLREQQAEELRRLRGDLDHQMYLVRGAKPKGEAWDA